MALVGDAELDEGSVWEAAVEDALSGLGNVTMIVDLNRQSLDRVIPGIRVRQIEGYFAAAGWQVVEAKYGRRLQALFAQPGGDGAAPADRRHDQRGIPGHDPQAGPGGPRAAHRPGAGGLPRRPGPLRRRRLRRRTCRARWPTSAATTSVELERALDEADSDRTRPSVVFAYTIKGWRLPFAGDSLNHSAHASTDQVHVLAKEFGADEDDPWAGVRPRIARRPALRGALRGAVRRAAAARRSGRRRSTSRGSSTSASRAKTSTQQVFGDTLAALARVPTVGAADRHGVARTCPSRPTSAAGSTASASTRPTRRPKHDDTPEAPPVGAAAGRPAHRARHQRDEPVHVAEPVRADRTSCSARR